MFLLEEALLSEVVAQSVKESAPGPWSHISSPNLYPIILFVYRPPPSTSYRISALSYSVHQFSVQAVDNQSTGPTIIFKATLEKMGSVSIKDF